MRVVALDPSLTCTGVAESRAPTEPGVLTPPNGLTGMGRLHWIQKQVMQLATGADLVVIEGYSHASRHFAHQLGELGGVIRLTLWCMRVPYVDVPPAGRMKIATGKGQAKKEAVLAEAIRRLGYTGSNDNEADAMWLLQLALHHYGLPGAVALPAAHLEPLAKSKAEWPVVDQLRRSA
jgi:crossover junction endodeoxyribonuclease RuvC